MIARLHYVISLCGTEQRMDLVQLHGCVYCVSDKLGLIYTQKIQKALKWANEEARH